MHIVNNLIPNQVLLEESTSLAYILGALIYPLFIYTRKEVFIPHLLILLAVFISASFLLSEFYSGVSMIIIYVAIGLANFQVGLLEILNLKLIVVNSNRPEYFVGMLYFLSYLLRTIFIFLYQ